MKSKLFLLTLAFIPFLASAQIVINSETDYHEKIKPWTPEKVNDFQFVYNFGFSELESYFILIVTKDSCYAQIKYGEFNENATDFIWNYENLKNVRIEGSKFYSDKSNGEFAIYENKKGLVMYNPWQSMAKRGEYEIGFVRTSLDNHYSGKFPYSSFRLLNKNELKKMSLSDLRIMRNEIYARYGYIFESTGDMDNYFMTQSWYHGQHKNVSNFITGLEKKNIQMIQMIEKEKNGL